MLHFHYSDKSGYKYPSLSLRIFNEWGVLRPQHLVTPRDVDLAIPAGRHHSSTRTPKCARTMCRNGRLENHATIMDLLFPKLERRGRAMAKASSGGVVWRATARRRRAGRRDHSVQPNAIQAYEQFRSEHANFAVNSRIDIGDPDFAVCVIFAVLFLRNDTVHCEILSILGPIFVSVLVPVPVPSVPPVLLLIPITDIPLRSADVTISQMVSDYAENGLRNCWLLSSLLDLDLDVQQPVNVTWRDD
ncbi:hypothetical protein LXL04_009702 [Taraxacum kok-saghyz]